jgi:hypothetical protein
MANKRGPLSKIEIFYILEHVKIGKDINDIALDLDRPIKSIEKYIKKSQPSKSSQQAQQANTTSPRLTAGDQFIKRGGTVVMTENASTISDSRKKSISSKNQSCITKVRSDE